MVEKVNSGVLETLESEKVRLEGLLQSSRAETTAIEFESKNGGRDVGNDATFVAIQDTGMIISEILESQLEGVKGTMEHCEAGEYGFCDRCKEPINPERLKAVPGTSLCIHCAKAEGCNR